MAGSDKSSPCKSLFCSDCHGAKSLVNLPFLTIFFYIVYWA